MVIPNNLFPETDKQECIVYLETYYKTSDGIDAYVDFRLDEDLFLFKRFVDLDNEKATFIELKSLKTSKQLRRGCYYKLNIKQLVQYQKTKTENSLLICASYDLSKMSYPDSNDTEILQNHKVLNYRELSMAYVPNSEVFDNISNDNLYLFVKNVGQGNWNELRSENDVKVLYDAGTEIRADETEVRKIFDSRKNDLILSKPVLVISHWDKDHIHCLKYLSINDIKNCFSKVVCPDFPSSVTSTRLINNFIDALGRKNVYCLRVPDRTNGIKMHLWQSNIVFISIYSGEYSRNTNYRGLVMYVKGK